MATIVYNASLALENDLFKLEEGDTNHPQMIYSTKEDKYSIGQKINNSLTQLDIKVRIFAINRLPTKTKVYTNSANFLATDINIDGEWYYYKTPVNSIPDYTCISRNLIDNYVYTKTDEKIQLEYINSSNNILTTSAVTPIKVFQNEATNLYIEKSYSVSKSKDVMILTFNKPNINIEVNNNSVFELRIDKQEYYPYISYEPFYIVTQKGNNRYEYDYSLLSPTIIDGQRYTNNVFKLFDYNRSSLVDFPDNKYNFYNCFVGFNPTKINNTNHLASLSYSVEVNDSFVYQSNQDGSIYSSYIIEKNTPDLDILLENKRPALLNLPIQNLIPSINSTIYKTSLPEVLYISDEHRSIKFQNIVGQNIKNLIPGLDIEGYSISDKIFKFDISSFSAVWNDNLLFDYNQSSETRDILLIWKNLIDKKFNKSLEDHKFYIFVSSDNISYTPLSYYYYDMSINNEITELTTIFKTDILNNYTHIKLGFLYNNSQITSLTSIAL